VKDHPEKLPTTRFFVTDGVERFLRIGQNLLKRPMGNVTLVDPVFEKLAEHGEIT
jgi:hypothetical protein